MTPPPVELLSFGGMGFVALYVTWEFRVAPILRRRRGTIRATTG